MRLNSMILVLPFAVLLLAKAPGNGGAGPGQLVEVRTSNASVEISGSGVDSVVVDASSNATVRSVEGREVVESDSPHGPLKLQVPRGASLDVFTSNGAIHVSGVAGPMRLTTSNGAITVLGAGAAEIHAHTSNGSIEVGLPDGANATVSAHTSNGRIGSDIEIVTNHLGENLLEGKVGNGGPVIDLQTSNGSIWLRTARGSERVSSTFKAGEVK